METTELKDKIIEAVIQEFNEKGIKFTMDDVAKRLGISKRTLYTVVDEKESLFIEAVDCVFQAIKESEREIMEDDSLEVTEKLKRILIVLPKKYESMDYRKLYEIRDKYPRIFTKIEERLESEWDLTNQLMQEAMDQGKIRKVSVSVFQAMFSGTIEYYLSRSVLLDSEISYEEGLSAMLDILFQGIVKKGE